MRKAIALALLASLASLAAFAAFASRGNGGAVRGAAARAGMMWVNIPAYDASNYVKSGLIALWDGIENAGVGVHNESAAAWVSHIGNYSMTYGSTARASADCTVFNNAAQIATGFDTRTISGNADGRIICTVEIVVRDVTKGAPVWGYGNAREVYFYGDGTGKVLVGRSAFVMAGSGNTMTLSLSYGNNDYQALSGAYRDGSTKLTVSTSGEYIGATPPMTFGSYSPYQFTGKLCCVRIYNRILTSAERKANYIIDKARFNLP